MENKDTLEGCQACGQLSKRVLSIFTPSEELVPEVLVAVAEGSQESPAVNDLEGGWISYHPGTIGSG